MPVAAFEVSGDNAVQQISRTDAATLRNTLELGDEFFLDPSLEECLIFGSHVGHAGASVGSTGIVKMRSSTNAFTSFLDSNVKVLNFDPAAVDTVMIMSIWLIPSLSVFVKDVRLRMPANCGEGTILSSAKSSTRVDKDTNRLYTIRIGKDL